jgi:hypothetical protein
MQAVVFIHVIVGIMCLLIYNRIYFGRHIMNFSAKMIGVAPSTLERFLENRFIWLFLSFVLSADIASSLYLATPLVKLESSNLHIGLILVFFTLFSILVLISWEVRSIFDDLTWPAIFLFKKKSDKDYKLDQEDCKRDYEAKMRHSVPYFKLREYAIEHNHQILCSLVQNNKENRQMERWTKLFMFIVGLLLSITPLLQTSTLHLLVFEPWEKSNWWILVVAIPLMLYGTHSDEYPNHLIYVGELAAKKINGS